MRKNLTGGDFFRVRARVIYEKYAFSASIGGNYKGLT
jgi:hypothetical protein